MSRVVMRVSRELLEQMFVLGDRRIVGAGFEQTPYDFEPTSQVVFTIEAPDAPDGATEMTPAIRRADDGTLSMVDPGFS